MAKLGKLFQKLAVSIKKLKLNKTAKGNTNKSTTTGVKRPEKKPLEPKKFHRANIGTRIDKKVRVIKQQQMPSIIAKTFKGRLFVTVETTEPVTLFRKFGGNQSQAKLDGAYTSTIQMAIK